MSIANKEVAERLKAARELCDFSIDELCEKVNMSKDEYLSYETGEGQIPISLVYDVSAVLEIGVTELLTGEKAKLHTYSLVRAGKGVEVDRNDAYKYSSLAYNFIGRKIEPLLVVVPPAPDDEAFHTNEHVGHEYHYCLEGSYKIKLDNHEILINKGDSLYFDSSFPHGMKGANATAKILVIVI